MKKYVFTKKVDEVVQTVIVETDGLSTINNFMVTGLICPKGMTYKDIVEAGFDLKMGDSVSSAQILNVAKATGCEVRCYEGDKLIEDESSYEEDGALTLPINFTYVDGGEGAYLYAYYKDDGSYDFVELPSADFTLPDPCWVLIKVKSEVYQTNQFVLASQETVDMINESFGELIRGTVVKVYGVFPPEGDPSDPVGFVMSVLVSQGLPGEDLPAIPVLMAFMKDDVDEVALTSEPISTPEPDPAPEG